MKSGLKIAFSVFSIAALPICGQADNAFTGFQAGANLGYEDVSMDWETQSFTSAFNANDTFAAAGDDSESMDDSAFSYGVFAGYNLAFSEKVIVGIELAIQESDISDSIDFMPGFDDGGSNETSTEVDVSETYLLGIKGGYLLDESTMIYSTLSATRTEVESSTFCPSDGLICNPFTFDKSFEDDDKISGWALSLGLEKSIADNLSVKVEYRYADLGTAELSPTTQEFDETFGSEADVEVISQTLQVGAAITF